MGDGKARCAWYGESPCWRLEMLQAQDHGALPNRALKRENFSILVGIILMLVSYLICGTKAIPLDAPKRE